MTSTRPDLAALQEAIRPDRLQEVLVAAVEQYSPTFAEGPALEVFRQVISGAGLPWRRQPVPGGSTSERRGNLIVELGPSPPALLLVGHVDTVVATDDAQLTPRRDGDLLHGLGTADTKSGCAALLEATLAVSSLGVEPVRGLALALVVGEEETGDGSRALARTLRAPLTVVAEPTGLRPCLDHHGYFELRLEARGLQAHAALPQQGASAIHAMLAWLTAVIEGAQQPAAREALVVSPRQITGGSAMFVVAGECDALVDVHSGPGVEASRVQALVEQAREIAAASHPDCQLAATTLLADPGYRLDPADPRLEPLRRGFAALGLPWEPSAFPSHSDAGLFHAAGSAPVVWGPGRLEVAHTPEEHVSLGQTEQAARRYAAVIREACFG